MITEGRFRELRALDRAGFRPKIRQGGARNVGILACVGVGTPHVGIAGTDLAGCEQIRRLELTRVIAPSRTTNEEICLICWDADVLDPLLSNRAPRAVVPR